MKKIFMVLMVFSISLGFYSRVNAQGETAVPFLLLAPDSKGAAIGESGTGLADNSAAIFWNPAGIAFLTGSDVSITHSKWLPQFGLDLSYDYLTFRTYMESIGGSITASLTFMNYGEFQRTGSSGPEVIGTFRSFDLAATVGYATKLGDDWGIGFNFRLIHSQLSDKPTENEVGEGVATTVSFDIAGMWRPKEFLNNKFSVGMNLSNLGPKISYIDQAQADPIPTNLRLGFAYNVFQDEYNSLTFTLDFSKLLVTRSDDTTSAAVQRDEFYEAIISSWGDQSMNEEIASIETGIGLEYWYGKPEDFRFAARAGFFYEDPNYGNRKFLTLGAGIRYDMFGFDFSYLTTSVFEDGENHPLSDTLRFTLLIGWGSVPQQIAGLPRGI